MDSDAGSAHTRQGLANTDTKGYGCLFPYWYEQVQSLPRVSYLDPANGMTLCLEAANYEHSR